MSLPKLDGPRIPATNGAARLLVVFLHGYGADGRDLIDIGREWQKQLPGAAFVAPHAHEPCGQSPMGRQWFPLTMREESERWRGCVAARPVLDAFSMPSCSTWGSMTAASSSQASRKAP